MASPKYQIDAYNGRTFQKSRSTNNLAQAEIIVDDYRGRYDHVELHRFRGIVQGVAVYDILKTYKGVKHE